FVGREAAMEAIKQRLAANRLVTLTGVGGIGKTRLSLQTAADLLDRYPDGVWQADLAALMDPSLVPAAIASSLVLREEASRPILPTLTAHLRSRTLLLVLDNCEHLIEACAEAANSLLHAAPNLRILATSREALAVEGENIWPVPPLAVPALAPDDSADTLSR